MKTTPVTNELNKESKTTDFISQNGFSFIISGCGVLTNDDGSGVPVVRSFHQYVNIIN